MALGSPSGQSTNNRLTLQNKSTECDLKLQELGELLYKNFPSQIAAHLFAQEADLTNTPSNDANRESLLNWLRMRSGSA